LSESRRNNMLLGEAAIWKKFLESAEVAEAVRLQAMDLLKHVVENDFSIDVFTSGLHSFHVPAKINFSHLLLELFRGDATPFQPDPAQWLRIASDTNLSEMPWYPQELSVLNELRRLSTFTELLESVR